MELRQDGRAGAGTPDADIVRHADPVLPSREGQLLSCSGVSVKQWAAHPSRGDPRSPL